MATAGAGGAVPKKRRFVLKPKTVDISKRSFPQKMDSATSGSPAPRKNVRCEKVENVKREPPTKGEKDDSSDSDSDFFGHSNDEFAHFVCQTSKERISVGERGLKATKSNGPKQFDRSFSARTKNSVSVVATTDVYVAKENQVTINAQSLPRKRGRPL